MKTDWEKLETPFDVAWRRFGFISLFLPMIFVYTLKNFYLHIVWLPIGIILLNNSSIFKPIKDLSRWQYSSVVFFLFIASTGFSIVVFLNKKLNDEAMLVVYVLVFSFFILCHALLGKILRKALSDLK